MIIQLESSTKENNIIKNMEALHAVISSVFTTQFNYDNQNWLKKWERSSGLYVL